MKRKCSKTLPKCSLCVRVSRSCDYSATPDDFQSLQQKVSELEAKLLAAPEDIPAFPRKEQVGTFQDASFPCTFFLDSNAFEYLSYTYSKPKGTPPLNVMEILGNVAETQGMLDTYFVTVHKWLPIVSRMRLYQYMSNIPIDLGSDMALLFLCMKLVMEPPLDYPVLQPESLYQVAKSFLGVIESQNIFSVQVMQAAILLAAYEIGHSIYPAAYLSVCHCVSLGHFMGLHERKQAPQLLPKCNTWTEQEERRRIWWAVIVLERYVNVGGKLRPLTTDDPGLDEFLPVDDNYWDSGTHTLNDPLAVSSSTDIQAAPFARTCQSAHLLSRVIRHLNDYKMDPTFRFAEALQLHRTVGALSSMLSCELGSKSSSEMPSLWTAIALSYSALIALYDMYSCTENAPARITIQPIEDHLEMQKASIEGLKNVTREVAVFARVLATFLETEGVETIGPLVSDALYAAGCTCAWYIRESGNREASEQLAGIRNTLNLLKPRWKVAGVYLDMIHKEETGFLIKN